MEIASHLSVLSNPAVQLLLDSLFKSSIILGIGLSLLVVIRRHISSAVAHAILLAALICVCLMPFIAFVAKSTSVELSALGTINVFVVSGTQPASTSS